MGTGIQKGLCDRLFARCLSLGGGANLGLCARLFAAGGLSMGWGSTLRLRDRLFTDGVSTAGGAGLGLRDRLLTGGLSLGGGATSSGYLLTGGLSLVPSRLGGSTTTGLGDRHLTGCPSMGVGTTLGLRDRMLARCFLVGGGATSSDFLRQGLSTSTLCPPTDADAMPEAKAALDSAATDEANPSLPWAAASMAWFPALAFTQAVVLEGCMRVPGCNMPAICCMNAMLANATSPAMSGTVAVAAGKLGRIDGTVFVKICVTGMMTGLLCVVTNVGVTTPGGGNTGKELVIGKRGSAGSTEGDGHGADCVAAFSFGKTADT